MADKLSLSEKVLRLLQSNGLPTSLKQILFRLNAYKMKKGVLSSLRRLESEGKIVRVVLDNHAPLVAIRYKAVTQQDLDADWESLLSLEPNENVIFIDAKGNMFTESTRFESNP